MTEEPMRWGTSPSSRAHVIANVTAGICLLAILGMGLSYVGWGVG